MARQNLISAEVADDVVKAAIQSIVDTRGKFPFLINLSKENRKNFRKMGPKSVEYVSQNLTGAQQFSNYLPADFPLQEFSKDAKLISQLYPLFIASQSFTEALSDSILALGSDSMLEADEVYDYLKRAAKRGDASAKALVDEISKRFKGQGKLKPKP